MRLSGKCKIKNTDYVNLYHTFRVIKSKIVRDDDCSRHWEG